MSLVGDTPVVIEDVRALKGQYLRHSINGSIWKVVDVGRDGVIVFESDVYGGPTYGPETHMTWQLVKYKYRVIVPIENIDVKSGESA